MTISFHPRLGEIIEKIGSEVKDKISMNLYVITKPGEVLRGEGCKILLMRYLPGRFQKVNLGGNLFLIPFFLGPNRLKAIGGWLKFSDQGDFSRRVFTGWRNEVWLGGYIGVLKRFFMRGPAGKKTLFLEA